MDAQRPLQRVLGIGAGLLLGRQCLRQPLVFFPQLAGGFDGLVAGQHEVTQLGLQVTKCRLRLTKRPFGALTGQTFIVQRRFGNRQTVRRRRRGGGRGRTTTLGNPPDNNWHFTIADEPAPMTVWAVHVGLSSGHMGVGRTALRNTELLAHPPEGPTRLDFSGAQFAGAGYL